MRWRTLVPVLWGASITVGAAYIRFGQPQEHSLLLAKLVGSEPFHVVAHALLYGALAWLFARRLGERVARVLACVLAMAVVQELAQSVGSHPFGHEEIFDLGVDALAALAVMGARRFGLTAAS